MPRPNIGRSLVAVRLDPDLLALLDQAAEESRSETIRAALRAYLGAAK